MLRIERIEIKKSEFINYLKQRIIKINNGTMVQWYVKIAKMTNKELQKKIISLETRINNLETRDSLGERISLLLPLLEDHAKTCPHFNGFIMSHTQDEDPENLFYQASVTFQCSCNQPTGIWAADLSEELNIPILQKYLEMINKKYRISKPVINNITDRLEL